MDLTKDEIINSKSIYEALKDHISKVAKTNTAFNEIRKEVAKILDKNSIAFERFGEHFLLNSSDEEKLLRALDLSKKEILEIYNNSPFLQSLGSLDMKEQIAFSIPLLLLAGEYLRKKDEEKARFLYLITFFKPFASIVFKYFRTAPNKDRMQYTIEFASERFDIKKYGTFGLLQKKSDASLENYREQLFNGPTDKELYVIFTSGVFSRINDTVKKIKNEYEINKDKYLPFETSTFVGEGDNGDNELVNRDIRSDSAVKAEIVRKATMNFAKNPIDTKFLAIACEQAYGSSSANVVNMFKETLVKIQETFPELVGEFFECLVSSILFEVNKNTGKKYTGADLKSPVFIVAAKQLFKAHHTNNKNIIRVVDIMKQLLENCCDDYVFKAAATKKAMIRDTLFLYLVFICRFSS